MLRTVVAGLVSTLALIAAACSAAPTPTLDPAAIPAPPAPAEAAPAASSDLVRLVLVPDQSKARYRVREQLAGVSLPDDAVGATQSFTGTIVGRLDGTIVSDQSLFQVDLRTLKSDEAVRDNFISRNVLETGLFPYATFVPTSAPGLPLALPPSGDLAFKLVGNLTIRNVTKPVTWDVTGQVVGTTAVGRASTDFTFEDFNLTQPRVGRVLSIVDSIRLELDLTLERE